VIVINLADAGLAHAKGKSDRCGGEHTLDMDAITEIEITGLMPQDRFYEVMQTMHEQAHPHGTVFWDKCTERGCKEAQDLEVDRVL
jgi:hypothetical protein